MLKRYRHIYRQGKTAAYLYQWQCPYILLTPAWFSWVIGNSKAQDKLWQLKRGIYGGRL